MHCLTYSQPARLGKLRCERGQGLIEYLIIVALMGVATIAIVRVMGEAVATRFAVVTHALQGESKRLPVRVDKSHYKKRDLGDFMSGAGARGSGDREGSKE